MFDENEWLESAERKDALWIARLMSRLTCGHFDDLLTLKTPAPQTDADVPILMLWTIFQPLREDRRVARALWDALGGKLGIPNEGLEPLSTPGPAEDAEADAAEAADFADEEAHAHAQAFDADGDSLYVLVSEVHANECELAGDPLNKKLKRQQKKLHERLLNECADRNFFVNVSFKGQPELQLNTSAAVLAAIERGRSIPRRAELELLDKIKDLRKAQAALDLKVIAASTPSEGVVTRNTPPKPAIKVRSAAERGPLIRNAIARVGHLVLLARRFERTGVVNFPLPALDSADSMECLSKDCLLTLMRIYHEVELPESMTKKRDIIELLLDDARREQYQKSVALRKAKLASREARSKAAAQAKEEAAALECASEEEEENAIPELPPLQKGRCARPPGRPPGGSSKLSAQPSKPNLSRRLAGAFNRMVALFGKSKSLTVVSIVLDKRRRQQGVRRRQDKNSFLPSDRLFVIAQEEEDVRLLFRTYASCKDPKTSQESKPTLKRIANAEDAEEHSPCAKRRRAAQQRAAEAAATKSHTPHASNPRVLIRHVGE